MQLELELEGALDRGGAAGCVQAVVERHASLRAAFRQEELSGRCRWWWRGAAVPWRLIDLSGLDAAEQERGLPSFVRPTVWSGSIWRRRR